jgi:hypothetical protein
MAKRTPNQSPLSPRSGQTEARRKVAGNRVTPKQVPSHTGYEYGYEYEYEYEYAHDVLN